MTKSIDYGSSSKLKFKSCDIEIDHLLLDPNNYRFLDNPGFKRKIKTKYHLTNVQESTLRLLEQDKKYQLSELKKSILANGYVPMERIIVIPYQYMSNKYLVIEGNRRVAALKILIKENKDGVIELADSDITSFSEIPCAILEVPSKSMQHAERVIMGIRHIAGPREWGAYQQAQLILELHDEEQSDFKKIGEHLGISTVEAARRYRAMKALKCMEQDELYAERAEPDFYRLFHEFVALPNVRVRFGWNSDSESFLDNEKSREFFELIAPDDTDQEAKLKTYSDVRKLKLIIGNKVAESALIDPDKSFSDAVAAISELKIVERHPKQLIEHISEFLLAVEQLGVKEIENLTNDDLTKINEAIEVFNKIVETHKKLS
jgi:hypothetical protein